MSIVGQKVRMRKRVFVDHSGYSDGRECDKNVVTSTKLGDKRQRLADAKTPGKGGRK